jgi:APA family basic amino acid/polyamine antiporter
MIGSGIFALPSVVAARAGILSPWLFLATGLLLMTVVLAFAELSSYFRDSGGPVLYATAAFGPLVGFSTGWMYYISRSVALAANSHVMAMYLGALWPWFGTGVGRIAVIVTTICGLTIVNVHGVKNGIRALSYFTLLKVVPLVAMIILGLQYYTPELALPSSLPSIDDLGGTVLLLLYAFIGFETVLITAGETEKPRATIPKTMILTVIATGIFYFLIMLVYNLVLPGVADPDATLVDVGRVLAGPVGVFVITLTAIFSIGGSLSSMMLAGPRLTFALAEHDLLPNWFKRVHERYSSPANSIMFLGGMALLIAMSGSFVQLAIATSLARLIAFIVCIAALPVIRRNADQEAAAHAYRLSGGYTIPAIAFILCLWVVAQSSLDSWLIVSGLLVLGLIPYFLTQRRNRKTGAA